MTASEIEQIEKAGTYIIDYTLNYGDLAAPPAPPKSGKIFFIVLIISIFI